MNGEQRSESERDLSKYPILIRYNEALSIIEKIQESSVKFLPSIISSRNPFGLPSNFRGEEAKPEDAAKVFTSSGAGWIKRENVREHRTLASKWKVGLSKIISEHALEPGKDGKYHILTGSLKILSPWEVCTDSYIVAGGFNKSEEACALLKYLKTRFARFLVLQSISSIHLTRSSFQFVPMQDFSPSSDIPWQKPLEEVEEALCKKYGLSAKETEFINSLIREW
ncbi:MAG: hypothetical protein IKS61_00440 [Aeriscardovia sp.]|nr:hypothetical protein [Aeriscardovia sp.]